MSKSIDYIKNSLPNRINLVLLNQFLEEDGSELSEELISYLKFTPENTNLNILKNFISESGSLPKEVEKHIYFSDESVYILEIKSESDICDPEQAYNYIEEAYDESGNLKDGYGALILHFRDKTFEHLEKGVDNIMWQNVTIYIHLNHEEGFYYDED